MCLLRHQKSMCIVYPQAQRAIIIRSRLLLLEEWLEERGREETRRSERASLQLLHHQEAWTPGVWALGPRGRVSWL